MVVSSSADRSAEEVHSAESPCEQAARTAAALSSAEARTAVFPYEQVAHTSACLAASAFQPAASEAYRAASPLLSV